MNYPPSPSSEADLLKQACREEAQRWDLQILGVTTPDPVARYEFYKQWVERGYHGEMGYLAREDRIDRRGDMELMLPGVKTVLFTALRYWPGQFPEEQEDPMRGVVSCYAWGRDYHKILRKPLKAMVRWCREQGGDAHWYVDTGPILEREMAERAGLGFVGKNTMLIHPRYGSGFFLGEILTTLEMPPHPPVKMPGCGSCNRCMVACPTDAFVEPYVMDARRCISYLTIENPGPIPEDLRSKMGNLIYGCDICQQVCPWTRFAGTEESPVWGTPPLEVSTPELLELMELDDDAFFARYEGTPILRIRRRRLLRNVAVALGNSGDPRAIPALQKALSDEEPLIREHAAWALEQLQAVSEQSDSID